MGSSSFWGKWGKRFKMLSVLPLPNRSLTYFPPDFTFRDPVLSILTRHRAKQETIALVLFHFENFGQWSTFPDAVLSEAEGRLRKSIKDRIVQSFKKKDIIGLKQHTREDYGVFVRIESEGEYGHLALQAERIRMEAERDCDLLESRYRCGIHLQTGTYILDPSIRDTSTAVHVAYHYAHSIATKKLSSSYQETKKSIQSIVRTEDIRVLVQPIMNLDSGDVFGWEILTRGPLNTPYHSPLDLFHFASQVDLLSTMEMLVVRKALKEIAELGIREQVFINVSSVTLCHPLFLDHVMDQIRNYPAIRPSQIIFEITERHSIRDYAYFSRMMKDFRKQGFRFAVDDAGAGYSSLQSITELIPDIIKIDKSVISNIDQVSAKQSMLQALLMFAKDINCQVVAEGIEREEEAELLLRHKVEMGQGFYFAKPEPFKFDPVRFDAVKKAIRAKKALGSAAV